MLGILFMLLGTVLCILCLISVFRNLLLQYKLNGNFKDALVVGLMIATLVSAYLIASQGMELKLLSDKKQHLSNSLFHHNMIKALIWSLVGYFMYGLHLFILDKIKKEKKQMVKENSSHLWQF